MTRALPTYVDAVVNASVPIASRALAPVVDAVERAVRGAGWYDAADAALRRLEGKAKAEGLESVLVGAMMNGTSAGGVDG